MDIYQQAALDYLGIGSYGEAQVEQAASAVLDGRDALLIARPGRHRSMAYLVPAALSDLVTVIIEPVPAKAAILACRIAGYGFSVAVLSSAQRKAQSRQAEDQCLAGRAKIIIITPDYLFCHPALLREMVRRYIRIGLFVVDEAQTASEISPDFNPSCRALASLRNEFPGVQLLAISQPIDRLVRVDLSARFCIPEPEIFMGTVSLPETFLEARLELTDDQKLAMIARVVNRNPGSVGIVFVLESAFARLMKPLLAERGIDARIYDEAMSPVDRRAFLEQFSRGEIPLAITTGSVGLALSYEHVRFVIHYHTPRSIEHYLRQAAAAGRDGQKSLSLLLHNRADVKQTQIIMRRNIRPVDLARLMRMRQYAEAKLCRQRMLAGYLGLEELLDRECMRCDVCRTHFELVDATVPAQKALSAIRRTGERERYETIIAILIGQPTVYIKKMGYDRLPTFGVGNEMRPQRWEAYLSQMIVLGLVETIYPENFRLAITRRGEDVLYGRRTFSLFDPNVLLEREEEISYKGRPFRPVEPMPRPTFKDPTLVDLTKL